MGLAPGCGPSPTTGSAPTPIKTNLPRRRFSRSRLFNVEAKIWQSRETIFSDPTLKSRVLNNRNTHPRHGIGKLVLSGVVHPAGGLLESHTEWAPAQHVGCAKARTQKPATPAENKCQGAHHPGGKVPLRAAAHLQGALLASWLPGCLAVFLAACWLPTNQGVGDGKPAVPGRRLWPQPATNQGAGHGKRAVPGPRQCPQPAANQGAGDGNRLYRL
jgi:hypothetical protein